MEKEVSERGGIDIIGAFAWVQEHANLCTVAALCHPEDHETRGAFRREIALSLERGTRLVDAAMHRLDGTPHWMQQSLPPDSHALGMAIGRANMVPVSGAARFEEGMVGRVRLLRPTSPLEGAPRELLPSRTYTNPKEPKKVS